MRKRPQETAKLHTPGGPWILNFFDRELQSLRSDERLNIERNLALLPTHDSWETMIGFQRKNVKEKAEA